MGKENDKTSKHSGKCTLVEIYKKKSDFINPVLVTFQNGALKNNALDLNVVMTPNDKGTSVEVETSVGHVFKESHLSRSPNQNQVIAIKNKKTNKMRLVEVNSAVLMNAALLTTHNASSTAVTYSKEIKNLYRTFGGKKAASQVIRSEKLNFSSMPVANELKQTIADMKVETDVSFNQSETESITDLLPPCHRDAVVLSDVYQIKEMLSETELEALVEEVRVMEENKFNPNEFSQFFMNCYTEAKKYTENVKIRLGGILFAETLIKFLKAPSRSLTSKKAVLCSFSSVISEKLLNEFCIKTEHSVTRPQTMRDKCICYVIAITLTCCNFQINLQLLQAAITSLHMARLLRLAKLVGAVPASKQSYLYTLKLPLPPLPKSQKGKFQRK